MYGCFTRKRKGNGRSSYVSFWHATLEKTLKSMAKPSPNKEERLRHSTDGDKTNYKEERKTFHKLQVLGIPKTCDQFASSWN